MNHNKNWQPTLLSLYRLQNSAMSTTEKQWVEITRRFWTVMNKCNWTHRMNFPNESEHWTNSSHFPNTEQSSRHSQCECHSLGSGKTKQYQKRVRKIFCLLSAMPLPKQYEGRSEQIQRWIWAAVWTQYKFLLKGGQPLELPAFVNLQNDLIYVWTLKIKPGQL